MNNWIAELFKASRSHKSFALVTLTKSEGSTPRDIGAKMIVDSSGHVRGSIGGGQLERQVTLDAVRCIQKKETQIFRYELCAKFGQCCGGTVEVLVETMNTHPILYVFGAGHVGSALCRVMVDTDFEIHLIDGREQGPLSENIPQSIFWHNVTWELFINEMVWDDTRTCVIIMTHEHDLDAEILEAVIRKNKFYMGLIGSQAKWARFYRRLKEKGFSDEELNNVRCPVGLDIGGKAPAEIAISIAASLIKARYGK